MASRVEAFPLQDGGQVLIEVQEKVGVHRAGTGEKVKQTFEQAWAEIRPAMSAVLKQLAELAPSEFEVKFGVTMGADFSAWIASAHGETTFEVTMSWKKADAPPLPPGRQG